MRLARQAPDVAQNVAQRTHFGPKAMTRAGACGHDRRAVCAYLPKFTSQQLCKGKLASAFEAFFEDGSRSCCVMACILHFCSIRKPKLKAYYETGMKSIVLVFDPNNALGKILPTIVRDSNHRERISNPLRAVGTPNIARMGGKRRCAKTE